MMDKTSDENAYVAVYFKGELITANDVRRLVALFALLDKGRLTPQLAAAFECGAITLKWRTA
jgi:hypothetical protein